MKTIDVEIRPEGGFVAKCIKTQDDRFILGKTYPSKERYIIGSNTVYGITDEYGSTAGIGRDYKRWYEDCIWVDYDFEEV